MTAHAASYERVPEGYMAHCRCGWSHRAPVKAGAVGWYRKHRLRPEMVCPTAPNETCGRHRDVCAHCGSDDLWSNWFAKVDGDWFAVDGFASGATWLTLCNQCGEVS